MEKKIYLEHVLRTEQDTLKFRLLALLVAALGIYLGRIPLPPLPAVALLVIYLIYALVLGRIIIPRFPTPNLVYGMILVDAVALTAGLFIAGGVENALVILLPVLIIYYAFYFGYSTSLFAATVLSLSYVGLALYKGSMQEMGSVIAVQVPFFYVIAVLSGYLSRRRIQELREKEELQEFIRVEMQARGLFEVAKRFEEALELEGVLDKVVEQLPVICGLSSCLVALRDEERGNLVGRAGNIELPKLGLWRYEELAFSPKNDLATSSALEKGEPAFAYADGTGDMPVWAQKLGAKRLLALPISVRGRNLGTIYAFDGGARSISEDEKRRAQAYCDFAANLIVDALALKTIKGEIRRVVGELEGTVERMEKLREPSRRRELLVSDLRIDGARATAFVGGAVTNLSPIEFEVLYALAENAGRPLSSAVLLRRVWGEGYTSRSNVVDVCVHRLRRKLEKAGSRVRILTIRGMGYTLSPGGAG